MRVGKRKNCYDLAVCAASVCAVSCVTQVRDASSIIYVVHIARLIQLINIHLMVRKGCLLSGMPKATGRPAEPGLACEPFLHATHDVAVSTY